MRSESCLKRSGEGKTYSVALGEGLSVHLVSEENLVDLDLLDRDRHGIVEYLVLLQVGRISEEQKCKRVSFSFNISKERARCKGLP